MQELDITFIFSILVLLVSVIAHEVSHGYAADFLGDHTARRAGRLNLNPLNHLDPIGSFMVPGITYLFGGFIFGWAKPVPYNPYNLRVPKWGPAIVAFAGPLANLFIALVFGLIIKLNLFSSFLSAEAYAFVSQIVLVNTVLAVFNMVPLPPLDGAKVFFTVFPSLSRVEEWLERYQVILLFLLVLYGWWPIYQVILFLFHFLVGGMAGI